MWLVLDWLLVWFDVSVDVWCVWWWCVCGFGYSFSIVVLVFVGLGVFSNLVVILLLVRFGCLLDECGGLVWYFYYGWSWGYSCWCGGISLDLWWYDGCDLFCVRCVCRDVLICLNWLVCWWFMWWFFESSFVCVNLLVLWLRCSFFWLVYLSFVLYSLGDKVYGYWCVVWCGGVVVCRIWWCGWCLLIVVDWYYGLVVDWEIFVIGGWWFGVWYYGCCYWLWWYWYVVIVDCWLVVIVGRVWLWFFCLGWVWWLVFYCYGWCGLCFG